jgi:hypothetical protein
MRHLIALSFCVVAGGCATTEGPNIYNSPMGQRVVGNETYVSIANVWNEMDALPLAETHCSQFRKAARFTRMQGYRAVFDCINR